MTLAYLRWNELDGPARDGENIVSRISFQSRVRKQWKNSRHAIQKGFMA